ncbi:MAG TPA: iron ABC transporter permease [Chloroflexota bacterium]|nr:iron ABC transporter permease [Chloroflexota bacterium]
MTRFAALARWRARLREQLLGTGLLLVVGFLTVFPLVMLAIGSVRTAAPGMPGAFSLDGYIVAYSDPQTYRTWANSLLLATQVTLVSTLIAVFFAWVVARTDTPGRGLAVPLMALVFAMPHLFFAMGWAMLGNPRIGLLNQLALAVLPLAEPPFDTNSWGGLVFVMALGAVPFKFLLILGAFRAMDLALEEASRAAGAGRLKTLLFVGLPILAPTILGVMVLSFVRGLQAFDVPLFLGLPAKIYVFSTRIFDYVANYQPARYAEASALAISLVVTMLGLVLLQWRILGRREFVTVTGKGYRPDVWRLGPWRYACAAALALYALLALVLPLGQMVLGSLQPVYGVAAGGLSFDNYGAALGRPIVQRALRNTILIAVGGGLLAMALTTLVAYVVARSRFAGRRALDLAAWLPWTMPGIVLGLSMLWAYLSVPGLKSLYGTPWLLLIGVVVTVIPVGVRVMAGAIGQVGRELEESARIHGAPWWRAFVGIVLRVTAPSFLYGWLVVGLIISGELSVPMLLYAPGSEMLGVAVYNLYTQGRAAEAAAVFCVILAAIAAAFAVAAVGAALARWAVRVRAAHGERGAPGVLRPREAAGTH